MKTTVKRQKAISGFLPTTYAVFCGEYLLKILTDKAQAERIALAYDDPEARKTMTDEEIAELHTIAASRYFHYAERMTAWHPGITFPDLEDAAEKYTAIGEEILRRYEEKKGDHQ